MKRFDSLQLAFLAFFAALNIGVGAVVGIIKLPIYLDSIGTVMAAALGGWFYGALVGVLAVVIAAIAITPTAPAYAGTAIAIALCASFFVKLGYLRSLLSTTICGLLIGIVSAIVSAPITTYLYGGVSLAGADAATAFFKATGNTLLESVIFGGLATDPVDKIATSIIAFLILRTLPKRLYRRFPNGLFFVANNENK